MKIFTISFLLALSVAATISGQSGYGIGDIATDFNLKGIDGEMHSLADMKEVQGYIVIFTCNHCPYAKMYENRIIALQEKYREKGYPVFAINPNDPDVQPTDSFEEMIVRAKEKKFNFPYLFDKGQKIFPMYGATKTPHIYLLDSDRVVRYIGAIDDNPREETEVEEYFLINAIEALRNGKTPYPSTTKAIGCSIKSK